MDIGALLKKYHHYLWALAAVVAAIVLVYTVTNIVGTLIGHAIGFAIIGALLYAGDYHFKQWIGKPHVQFLVAVALAIAYAIVATNGLVLGAILLAWHFVVLMCTFSLSAVFWPNQDAVAQRLRDVMDQKVDPVTAMKEAAGAVAGGVKGGLGNARDQVKRASGINNT